MRTIASPNVSSDVATIKNRKILRSILLLPSRFAAHLRPHEALAKVGVISKPFTMDALRAKVKELLQPAVTSGVGG